MFRRQLKKKERGNGEVPRRERERFPEEREKGSQKREKKLEAKTDQKP